MRYDVAVIGTGPAGISAAITAKIRNKSVLLLGPKKLSSKINKAHTILNYPGLPNLSGEGMAHAFSEHLSSLSIEITDKRARNIYTMGDYFSIQTDDDFLESSSLILATGVVTQKALPGEEENLGMGVSYCATCDAALYKNRECAVIAYSPEEESEAIFLSELASKVFYFPMYKNDGTVSERLTPVFDKVAGIEKRAPGSMTVKTVGPDIEVSGVFVLREAQAPGTLVPGLVTEGGHVKVSRTMETNIPGLFAAGDVTGLPYQYIKSAGEGNIAAISAAKWLDNNKKER